MTRRLRVAFGRISQESNALSPVQSKLEDFEAHHYVSGEDLLTVCAPSGQEVPGFLRNAELSGFAAAARSADVELVPLFSAWAVPGGPLSPDTHQSLKDRLVNALKAAGPVDGVLLSFHGALRAEGRIDPESDYLRAAREVVGPALLAVTFDLHGQISREKLESTDLLAAYRTNPHRDHARIGRHLGELLFRTLRGEVQPTRAWRTLPMVLGGGTTIDLLHPMRPIFRRMKQMEKHPAVLSVSLFMSHLWNDSPDLGWSVVVTTDDDPTLAEELAEELADRAWAVRDVPPPHFPGPEEAVEVARSAWLARFFGVVCICDASDAVGAGAAGENTALLSVLLERARDLRTLCPLRDAEAVEALWDRTDPTEVTIGGRLDPERNSPLTVCGTVRHQSQHRVFGRRVVLDLDHVQLVLTEGPPLAMKPSFYSDVGLNPWGADIVVVKSLFPFRLYFLALNRKTLYVKTRGVTDLTAVTELSFTEAVYPKDSVADWRPADRRRRGIDFS
jgi:microcystin degradation protein MlrC